MLINKYEKKVLIWQNNLAVSKSPSSLFTEKDGAKDNVTIEATVLT